MTYRATRALALPAALVASVALAAPAAAQTGPDPEGQLELGSLEQAGGTGSVAQLLPGDGAQPVPGETAGATADNGVLGGVGSVGDSGAAASAATQPATGAEAAAGQGQISQYAAGAPGTFDPEALAQLSPQTATALGAVGSAAVGSAALSLGPQGSQTGSVLLGGIIPGLTYVPGGSLGGEFVTSVGLSVPARTVFQGALGLGSSALLGYFEMLAEKQERAELTQSDIDTWTGVFDGVDELRAVASLPPLERSDPRVQVPVIEPCRRDYPDQAELEDEEAEAQCTAATEAIARGETWTSPDGTVTVTPEDAAPVVLGADGKPVKQDTAGASDDNTDGDTDGDTGGARADEGAGTADAAAPAADGAAAAGAADQAARPVLANGAAAAPAQGTQAAGPQLASTGAAVGDLALAALTLLAAGGGMILAARRRA